MSAEPFEHRTETDAGDSRTPLPTPDAGPTEQLPAPLHVIAGPGTRIGPYKILQLIGEGGMGVSTWPSRKLPSDAVWH